MERYSVIFSWVVLYALALATKNQGEKKKSQPKHSLLCLLCFCYILQCFAVFLLCFAVFCYVFAMFCYVFARFCYVLLCFLDSSFFSLGFCMKNSMCGHSGEIWNLESWSKITILVENIANHSKT